MFTIKRITSLVVFILLVSNSVLANAGIHATSDESSSVENANGGYFELGLGLGVHELGGKDGESMSITGQVEIAGAYRYNGFFIDASRGSIDGLSIGYNFVRSNDWEVDLLISSARGSLNNGEDELDLANSTEAERNDLLDNRDTFYNGAGIKVTRYLGNTVIQYRLLTDIHDGNGIISSARLGHSVQRKNWTFNGVLAAHYASEKTANYWHGVSNEEATTLNPAYSLGSTIQYTAEIGASYPITEHLVFRSAAFYALYDKDAAASPLHPGEYALRTNVSIWYVF